MLAGVWAARPRPLLVQPGTLKSMNSNRSRVLDAKTVTHLNSARVSFMNRRKNGDSFAKAPAARESPRVGPRSQEWAAAWAALVRARVAVVGRAASRVGPCSRIRFQISSEV